MRGKWGRGSGAGAGAGERRASRALVAGELRRLWGGERNEREGVAAAEGAGREQQGAGVEGELPAGWLADRARSRLEVLRLLRTGGLERGGTRGGGAGRKAGGGRGHGL